MSPIRRDLVPMRWGLIPSWWKKRARKSWPPSMRVRTRLPTGRCFVMRLGATDCPIPASGYYEWLASQTGKQPYYYTGPDDSPLTWDEWKDRETGTPLQSYTMVVTTAQCTDGQGAQPHSGVVAAARFRWLADGTTGTEYSSRRRMTARRSDQFHGG